jgi:hypothetical protein
MEKDVQERFERIETLMERFAVGMNVLRIAHTELEAAQLNTSKTIDRLSKKVEDVAGQVGDLAILVDQLIKKDPGHQ